MCGLRSVTSELPFESTTLVAAPAATNAEVDM
jgi:hypothetical protein